RYWTYDGDEELVSGRRCLFGYARHTAEDEQGDAVNVQSTRASEKRMAELVHQHRAEQQQGRNDPENPVGAGSKAGVRNGEVALSERPGNQDKSEQPRIVD